MSENRRFVPGTDEKYIIDISTKEGKCISLCNKYGFRKTPYLLDAKPDKKGYIYWRMKVDGYPTVHQAARWIAITFPELVQNEYFPGAEIDHIDTDRLNNHPNNLRWVTRKENQNNPLTRIHNSEAHKGKTPTEETRRKMSKTRKGMTIPNDVRDKISKSHKGLSPSKETKEKIANSLKGRPGHKGSEKQKQATIEANKKRSKPILQIDKNTGEIIKEHKSLADAALFMSGILGKKVFDANISKAALKNKNACGYKWRYK